MADFRRCFVPRCLFFVLFGVFFLATRGVAGVRWPSSVQREEARALRPHAPQAGGGRLFLTNPPAETGASLPLGVMSQVPGASTSLLSSVPYTFEGASSPTPGPTPGPTSGPTPGATLGLSDQSAQALQAAPPNTPASSVSPTSIAPGSNVDVRFPLAARSLSDINNRAEAVSVPAGYGVPSTALPPATAPTPHLALPAGTAALGAAALTQPLPASPVAAQPTLAPLPGLSPAPAQLTPVVQAVPDQVSLQSVPALAALPSSNSAVHASPQPGAAGASAQIAGPASSIPAPAATTVPALPLVATDPAPPAEARAQSISVASGVALSRASPATPATTGQWSAPASSAQAEPGVQTVAVEPVSHRQVPTAEGVQLGRNTTQQPVRKVEARRDVSGHTDARETRTDRYLTPRGSPTIPVVAESVPAPDVEIVGHEEQDSASCINRCDCVPIILGGVTSFVTCAIAVLVAAVLMSHVFSKGFFSSMFFRGGGFALLLSSGLGLLVGGLTGGLVRSCWPGALYLGGGLMAFAASVVLLGKRGAGVGALGGLLTGASIGALISPGGLSISLGSVVGFLLGIVVGFAPIFRELKMNSRYIRYGLESRQQSMNARMTSGADAFRSESLQGRQRLPFRMFSSPTKPASVRSGGSLVSESEPENRRADSLPPTSSLSPRL